MTENLSRARALFGGNDEPVIVLERLARGGGATNWWLAPDEKCLDAISDRLQPGSAVSVYTAEYLREMPYFDEGRREARRVLADVGEVCLGLRAATGCGVDMEFVAGAGELAEFEATLGFDSRVVVGEFPPRVDDGRTGVTWIVPDADGVVRDHPH